MGAIRKGLVTCRPCIRPARGHQVVGPLVNVNVTRLCPPSLCFRPRYNRGKRLRYRPPLCVSAPQDEYADAHIVLLTSRGRSLLQEDAIQKVGGGGISAYRVGQRGPMHNASFVSAVYTRWTVMRRRLSEDLSIW